MNSHACRDSAFRTTKQGGVLLLDQHAHIQFADPSIEHRRGFAPAETYLKNPSQLWGGNMGKEYYKTFWHRITSQHITTVEITNRHGNGTLQKEDLTVLRIPAFGQNYFFELQPAATHKSDFLQFTHALNDDSELSYKNIHYLFNELLFVNTDTCASYEELVSFFIQSSESLFVDRTIDSAIFAEDTSNNEKLLKYYERYHRIVLQYFGVRVCKEDAEDLTHEVFLSAWKRFDAYHPLASYKTYLMRIAHNRYVDWLRKYGQDVTHIELQDQHLTRAQGTFFGHLNWDLLKTRLSAKERELIVKHYLEGYKLREIAASWNMTENAIKLRISRARKKLRSLS